MSDDQNSTNDELDGTEDTTSKTPSPSASQGIHPQVQVGDERARAAQVAAGQQGSSRLDTTIRGGRYQNAQGKFVNAHGQEIDDEGNVTDGSETPAAPVAE